MTSVESLFADAKCFSCSKMLPVERAHLFRNAQSPSKIERITFCSKDCEIDFSTKGTADLAKAFLLSMNELSEDSMRVIERKFKIARDRVQSESKIARTIKCERCGHAWLTTSAHKMVSCPSCLGKTPNLFSEPAPAKRARGRA